MKFKPSTEQPYTFEKIKGLLHKVGTDVNDANKKSNYRILKYTNENSNPELHIL